MSLSYHHPLDVLRFAANQAALGMPFALIVTSNVTGGTMRAPGALMCVPLKGDVAGYISNGCVDADIIFQARQALSENTPRFLRYGEGSPFKDITLPCGGRIDLWVIPDFELSKIAGCVEFLELRRSVALEFGVGGFSFDYHPKLRLRIAGKGEAVKALVAQAKGAGFDCVVQSPEAQMLRDIGETHFVHLSNPDVIPESHDDAFTAVILMFHDHDWEAELLVQALGGPAFYIGAMGSAKTHKLRCDALRERGLSGAHIDRISGPIGLIPSMRDANLLALSALAEIVKEAQKAGRL